MFQAAVRGIVVPISSISGPKRNGDFDGAVNCKNRGHVRKLANTIRAHFALHRPGNKAKATDSLELLVIV